MSLTDPVTATLLHLTSLWRNVPGTLRVGHDGVDVLAGLVEADPVVPAPHSVLDDAHVENSGAVVEASGHYLTLHVFVLVIGLYRQRIIDNGILPLLLHGYLHCSLNSYSYKISNIRETTTAPPLAGRITNTKILFLSLSTCVLIKLTPEVPIGRIGFSIPPWQCKVPQRTSLRLINHFQSSI